MLKAPAISFLFLLHDVPAAGDVTDQLSVRAMGPARGGVVEVVLDFLLLLRAELLPAAFANRPIISIVAVVATISRHSE